MARMYTVGRIKPADVILQVPYNNEINQSVGEFNGGLDQHNMPLDSVTRGKLEHPAISETGSLIDPPYQVSRVMPSQDYHLTEFCEGDTTTAIDATEWQLGWNKFESIANPTGFVLDFVSSEGMLVGESCIDVECRISMFLYYVTINDVGQFPRDDIKDQHTGEIGIFVNDLLVGRTGPLYFCCGRHSYVVPYSTPIGSGPCHIDVRWMINFHNQETILDPDEVTTLSDDFSPFTAPVKVRNRILWCRNVKR